jgi:hypothetical protein
MIEFAAATPGASTWVWGLLEVEAELEGADAAVWWEGCAVQYERQRGLCAGGQCLQSKRCREVQGQPTVWS